MRAMKPMALGLLTRPFEFMRQFRQVSPRHAPEVAEEGPLHAAGADEMQGLERERGSENTQIHPPPAVALQDKIAEERLSIVGEESLVEVEEGKRHGVCGQESTTNAGPRVLQMVCPNHRREGR